MQMEKDRIIDEIVEFLANFEIKIGEVADHVLRNLRLFFNLASFSDDTHDNLAHIPPFVTTYRERFYESQRIADFKPHDFFMFL